MLFSPMVLVNKVAVSGVEYSWRKAAARVECLTMILDYELTTFICMIAIVLVAGTIKITLGVGFALIATPLLLLVMDANEVVGFIAPLILLQDLIILTQMWRWVPWRSAAILAVSATVIAPFASVLQTVLNPETLQITISITIIAAGITLLSGVKFSIKNEARALVVAGGISGVLFPLAGISGPPVALFLVNQRWEMATMRAVLAAFLVVLELVTIFAFAFRGVVNRDSLLLDTMMLPSLVVAVLISTVVLRRIDSNRYRTSVTTVIVLSALLGLASLIISSV
ncbi:uncharacterized protein METZ01_LOCUS144140 [marine metagenome]|uniref:Membrane transporter protein n=1 Tax=marine metagenome TaxID=408172 RepID=A0A381ZPW7_9ZZZZ